MVLLPIILALIHALGFVSAVRAVMEARTAQGSIAWAVALIGFPYLALPLYWIFGTSRFAGYVVERRASLLQSSEIARNAYRALETRGLLAGAEFRWELPFERLAKLPVTTGNDAKLLVNGDAAFAAMFDGIRKARDYVLVQFFIFRDDRIGREFQDVLLERARGGVRVFMLYDPIGCMHLPRAYLKRLTDGGVQVRAFRTPGRRPKRLQINFRNHRKIVIADGRRAWVGGLNVGDEYLGRDPKYGFWRDTHMELEGPVVQEVQVAFSEDWHFASGERLSLDWEPRPAEGGARRAILALPSGPADDFETCTLFFVGIINAAKSRLWIATPYFVPDEQFITSVQLAALRGVDVRILVPKHNNHPLVALSTWTYVEELEAAGAAFYQYPRGFMHQKVTLIDDDTCTVGTANFDNRSFRLNFEITVAVTDRDFTSRVQEMLESDFAQSERITAEDFRRQSLAFRFAARAARLAAPVQ